MFPGLLHRFHGTARSRVCRRSKETPGRQAEAPGTDHPGALRERPCGRGGGLPPPRKGGIELPLIPLQSHFCYYYYIISSTHHVKAPSINTPPLEHNLFCIL